ncbi:BrnT family toxin [Agaribacter flavus]|uniref:BrnT family toxin n=1 Tax=Agaribacter flavus TaxID=1902781 RepID=A0ABV7FUL7_9ALTE
MSEYSFEWDENKNASSLAKHAISFDEASTVFDDFMGRIIPDPDHSIGEERFLLLGNSANSRLLIVCHCVRVNESIRIISARKADKRERQIYEGYRNA